MILLDKASTIDGDTLENHGTRIQLWGVDAPESSQLCRGADSNLYRCGAKAANDLDSFVARRPVNCTPVPNVAAPKPPSDRLSCGLGQATTLAALAKRHRDSRRRCYAALLLCRFFELVQGSDLVQFSAPEEML